MQPTARIAASFALMIAVAFVGKWLIFRPEIQGPGLALLARSLFTLSLLSFAASIGAPDVRWQLYCGIGLLAGAALTFGAERLRARSRAA